MQFKCDLTVRCELYRLHVPPPPSACRGTQTSVIGEHFLEKDNLKRMNLNTNFKVRKKCREKLASMFDLRNAYQKQKTYIKHSSGLHPGETFYLIVSLLHFSASI